jgi:hypothetical protein
MRSLQQLEKEAGDCRAQFNATLLDVQSRLTLPGLAKEALRQLDPHLTRLPSPFPAVKRHPVIAAAALAGVSWLLRQVLGPARRTFRNGRTAPANYPHVRSTNPKTLRKETIHESH